MPPENRAPFTNAELSLILRRTMFASKSRAMPAAHRDTLYDAVAVALAGDPFELRIAAERHRRWLRPHRDDPTPLP